MRKPPMSGDRAAIEKSRGGQRIDSRANRSDPPDFFCAARNPARYHSARWADACASPSGNDERVQRRSVAQSRVWMKEQARFSAEWFASQTDDCDFVACLWLSVFSLDSRDRERVGGTDEIQTLNAVVSDQANAERFHFGPRLAASLHV